MRFAVFSSAGYTPRVGRAILCVIAGGMILPGPISAQALIETLDQSDPVYRQHQQLVAEYHQAVARSEEPPPLLLFAYRPPGGGTHDGAPDSPEDSQGDRDQSAPRTLFEIASRLMIPYSAIATLNRIDSPSPTELPDPLLIPSRPGLFIPVADRSPLEERIFRRLDGAIAMERLTIPMPAPPRGVLFAPDVDFSPEERDTFLRVRFISPIQGGRMSSRFGYRHHPVTGLWSFHEGLDVAADFGTPVQAAADGVIGLIERDPWYGLSVTIEHRGGYSTVYAHLQESFVRAGGTVKAGDPVGTVGSTGMSTGPHLHFEIRRNGEPRDPERYLR